MEEQKVYGEQEEKDLTGADVLAGGPLQRVLKRACSTRQLLQYIH